MGEVDEKSNVGGMTEKKFKDVLSQVDKLRQDISDMQDAQQDIKKGQETIVTLLELIEATAK